MNYFEFYVGDYARDTTHLTLIEHGAYLMLMATYYGSEKPLPAELPMLYRIARAMTPPEQKAVRTIAEQFFPVDTDGLRHNRRADDLIAKAQVRIEAARSNGGKGGRPRKNPAGNPVGFDSDTQQEPSGEPTGKAHQTPYTKEQKNEPNGSSASAGAEAPPRRSDPIPYQAIVDAYNATLTGLAKVREVTAKRKTALRREWQATPQRRSLGFWQAYFAECQDDPFLNGAGPYKSPHENWRPDFDYLLRAEVVVKVFERAMDRLDREDKA